MIASLLTIAAAAAVRGALTWDAPSKPPRRKTRAARRPEPMAVPAASSPSSAGETAAELLADLEAARGRMVRHPMEQRLFRKPCRARDAHTGRACQLLERHPGGDPKKHRHGRTEFTQVAAEGQTHFPGRDDLDARASAQSEPVIDLGRTRYLDPERDRARKARERAAAKACVQQVHAVQNEVKS